MRSFRTPGSARGASSNRCPYLNLPKNLRPMQPKNDKRLLIPLEDIVATLVIIVVLAGVTLLILRWIS